MASSKYSNESNDNNHSLGKHFYKHAGEVENMGFANPVLVFGSKLVHEDTFVLDSSDPDSCDLQLCYQTFDKSWKVKK